MEATMDLTSLLEAPTWDAETIAQVRREAFGSNSQLEQFKSWVNRLAKQDDRTANLKAGIALLLLGQAEQAVELLKQAGEGGLKRYYLGLALREAGQFVAAVTEFERAADKGWPALDAALQQVDTLRRAGRLDEAEKLLGKQARTGEKAAEYHYQRGCLLARGERADEAFAAFSKAVELDADHAGACFQLGCLYCAEGSLAEAVTMLRRCVENPPAPVSALVNLAVIYEDQGNYDLAIRCLQEVLKADPNDARARMYLKDALAGLTQYYDEAQERARDKRTQILEIPITDFELSVRSRNCLKKMSIHTLGDLLRVSETDLLNYKNFGETSLGEIKAVLAQKGLRLGQGIEEERSVARRSAAHLVTASGGPEDVLNKSVDDLELSVRARRCLERLGLRTLGDVSSRTEAELLAAKNFGVTSLTEIKQQLANFGLSLRALEE
jgi:DNA-directed RNA polymerase subunit alpha